MLLGREIDSLVCKSFGVRIAFPWDIHYTASEESLQKYMHPISKVLDTAMTNCPLPDHLLHSNHKRTPKKKKKTPHLIKQRRHVVKSPCCAGIRNGTNSFMKITSSLSFQITRTGGSLILGIYFP